MQSEPAKKIALHAQKHSGAFANAFDKHQLRNFSGNNALKRAKARKQQMRKLVGVSPRDSIRQQELEKLVIQKRLGSVCFVLFANALTMSAVDGIRHGSPPNNCFISIVDSQPGVKTLSDVKAEKCATETPRGLKNSAKNNAT